MKRLSKIILPFFLLLSFITTVQADEFTGKVQTINVGNDFLFLTFITEPGNQYKIFGAWETGASASKNFDSLVTLLSDAYQANSSVRLAAGTNGLIWLVAPANL